ncbi:hypothetical protein BLNAU_6274 [Blattamonas nauphoetae]|uniref:Uncharacterized protein n=1 Tax=Blattamonas nauphoetae TaxID=2049346 RepID=A0ABQ9Y4V7_9EUKA|nr:hypothetical protein BLNAU_6274 [Blattamonas nauphoetae]
MKLIRTIASKTLSTGHHGSLLIIKYAFSRHLLFSLEIMILLITRRKLVYPRLSVEYRILVGKSAEDNFIQNQDNASIITDNENLEYPTYH